MRLVDLLTVWPPLHSGSVFQLHLFRTEQQLFRFLPNRLMFLKTGLLGGAPPAPLTVAPVGAFPPHILPVLSSAMSQTVPRSHVETLPPRIAAHGGVWRQGLYRGDEVTYEVIRWPGP